MPGTEKFKQTSPVFLIKSVMKKEYLLKRPFDFSLSLVGVVISSPLWLIISLLIKAEDNGPVFYTQNRVGIGGKLFKTYKFRTMIPESDQLYGYKQAGEDDKRITGVGKYLRYTAMDELPQLLSILSGDMSFVGPRALLPDEIEVNEDAGENVPIDQIPGFLYRQSVRPGLTGIAQVYAPRDINRKNKFRYDKIYINNMGFLLDLKLIFQSFWITFRGTWESRDKKF